MSKVQREFVGIICDGNRNWAMEKFGVTNKQELSTDQLHEAYETATQSIRNIMDAVVQESIGILALWGLSDKNITERNEENLSAIFNVLQTFFEELMDNWVHRVENENVRLVHLGMPLGHLPDFSKKAVTTLSQLIEITKHRVGSVVAFCLNYNGETEQLDAIRRSHDSNQDVAFRNYLSLPTLLQRNFQPVDAIIRTGTSLGEPFRRGHFLQGYECYETAYLGSPIPMPTYNATHFSADMDRIRKSKLKKAGT